MAGARRKRQDSNEWYTVPQAADALGVSVSTVWRWIRANRLPAYRFGPKAIRLRQEDARQAGSAIAQPSRRPPDAPFRVVSDQPSALRPMTADERRRANHQYR